MTDAEIDPLVPVRVVFNFLAECNMSCPCCFCPFDGQEADISVWKQVIDRIAEWRTQSITFGGGDPFLYKEFPELLSYTNLKREQIALIQVDTNGLLVREEHCPLIKKCVNLLGLPLDGSNPTVHAATRGNRHHFGVVTRLLECLTSHSVPVKINTVVTQKNLDDLENLQELLSCFSIVSWSLYEFWDLGPSARNHANEYLLPHALFLERTAHIRETCDFARVEARSVASRHHTYFLVSQTGRAYTINRDSPHEYVELGSVFDDDVIRKWNVHADQKQNVARLKTRIDQMTNNRR